MILCSGINYRREIKLDIYIKKNVFHLVLVYFAAIVHSDIREKLQCVSRFYLAPFKTFFRAEPVNFLGLSTVRFFFSLTVSHASNVNVLYAFVTINKGENSSTYWPDRHKLLNLVIKQKLSTLKVVFSECMQQIFIYATNI